MEEQTKRCPRCGRTLSISEFGSNKSKKDGHSDYCRECTREISKETYRRKKEYKDAQKGALKGRDDMALDNWVDELDPWTGSGTKDTPVKETRQEVRERLEGVKKNEKPDLVSISTPELIEALKGRGKTVLVDPTPRELMLALKEKGYTGTLDIMVKQTISLAAIN